MIERPKRVESAPVESSPSPSPAPRPSRKIESSPAPVDPPSSQVKSRVDGPPAPVPVAPPVAQVDRPSSSGDTRSPARSNRPPANSSAIRQNTTPEVRSNPTVVAPDSHGVSSRPNPPSSDSVVARADSTRTRPKLPLIYDSSSRNRPSSAEQQSFNNWLGTQREHQPDAIRAPRSVPVYRSPLPTHNYRDWNTAWNQSRSHDNSKRWFYRNYCTTRPAWQIVYRYGYRPTPVYQYWPYGSSSYYYWGYNDCQWDPVRGTNVVIVYAPQEPETRVVENTTVIYRDAPPSSTYKIIRPDDADYELYRGYQDDKLDGKQAGADIEEAWTEGKLPGIAQHLDRDMPIRMYDSGEYLEWITDRSFLANVRDSMDENGTRSFIVEAVRPVRKGEVMLYAKHVLDKPTKRAETLYERYTLEHVGVRWLISAYETSATSILDH